MEGGVVRLRIERLEKRLKNALQINAPALHPETLRFVQMVAIEPVIAPARHRIQRPEQAAGIDPGDNAGTLRRLNEMRRAAGQNPDV